MSTVDPGIDLGAFARKAPEVRRPRRRVWLWLLPALLLAGFGGVLLSTFTDFGRSVVRVTIVRPIPAEGASAGGELLFQAAGWVEPDPFPVLVTPLTSGVIEALLVQSADRVEAGAPVARLVARDAELALERARAELAQADADCDAAHAELTASRAAFDAALELGENVAVAEADAAGRLAERDHRAAAVAKGRAQVEVAEHELALQEFLTKEQAEGPRAVDLARARVVEAKADLAVLEADAALAAADADKAQARRERMRGERELRIAEHLRIDAAAARLKSAEAMRGAAAARQSEAELALARTRVAAPSAGVVLAVLSAPGAAVGMGGEAPQPICSLYDPEHLRVRVDVPQDQVGKAGVGLLATIASQARRDEPYRGEVTRVVQQADVNKVTLQIHVRVVDPDALLRPEMLCTVAVFGAASAGATEGAGGARVRIPARLVGEGDQVWVIDGETGRATRRRVAVASRDGDGVIVSAGLDASDKVIDEGRAGLADGARVTTEGGP